MKTKKPSAKKVKITLEMDYDRAHQLIHALEVVARVGMFQFKDMLELLNPKISWDDSDMIEKYLKSMLSDLPSNAYKGIRQTPEECKIAWDAYQWIRRELSWHAAGKDWRTDKRDWTGPNSMMGVYYDEPFKTSSLPGDFNTRIDGEKP